MFLLMTSIIWKAISSELRDTGTVCKPSPNMSSNDGQRLSEKFLNAITYSSLGTFGTFTVIN